MKKKVALLVCAMLTISLLGACGKGKESGSTEDKSIAASVEEEAASEATSVVDDGLPVAEAGTPLSEIITLGQYENLELNRVISKVSDEEVDEAIAAELYDNVNDPEYGAQNGDIVDIAFVGKKDGVAFEGGTSESYNLTLGSNSFIPGFEDGCIGMKLDETRDLNLTFPENYQSAELAGQEVVFTVTINAISRPVELTDEWVAANHPEHENADSYRKLKRDELEAANLLNADNNLKAEIMGVIVDNATFTALSAEYIAAGEKVYDDSYNYMASLYGMDLATFIENTDGQEAYDAAKNQYARNACQRYMVLHAIEAEKGWSEEDEETQRRMLEYGDMNGGMSIEELKLLYGEENLYLNILADRVLDLAMESAVITDQYLD